LLKDDKHWDDNCGIGYTDEIFNEALTIIEDACLLISGKHLNQWGLTLTDQI
jgi:hypothetical protein